MRKVHAVALWKAAPWAATMPVMADPWWTDEECAPALLAEVVRELDTRDQVAEDVVLWRLLCAAWPTAAAQLH